MSGSPFENELIKDILKDYRAIWAIGHAQALMGWDSETYMPREGVEERAVARAELSVLQRSLLLKPEFVGKVEKAQGLEGLNEYEAGVVRVLARTIDRLRKIPEKLLYEKVKVSQEAVHVWVEAKKSGDFERFKPYLEKIVELTRETAERLGYDEHPYDALLDMYEEGLLTRDVDSLFQGLIPGLRRILDKVLAEGYYPQTHPLEDLAYDTRAMEEVNRKVLDLLGYPWTRGRLDVSPHPFTISLGIRDVRITTRYEGRDPRKTVYAVIHEYGHALYELQQDERLLFTPIAGGVSLGVHESQSRFWENVVGRSPWFTRVLRGIMAEHLPAMAGVSEEEFYRYVNTVRPSLIRVDADEVTYNFHIYLRFVLEKQLVAGEIRVSDLPELWDNMMEELLGVRPKSPSEGVLQDIHWSHGSIGYFPTYTIGTVTAARIGEVLEAEVASLQTLIGDGRIAEIREFLREKIHRWGSTLPPKELLARSLSWSLSPEPLLAYLERKYLGKYQA